VFSISPTSGAVADLYKFRCGGDGCDPLGPLVNVGSSLYGSTSADGIGCVANNGCGTVLSGGSDTLLYSFAGAPDGSTPTSGLVGTLFSLPLSGGLGRRR
jgi:hypothetical protein